MAKKRDTSKRLTPEKLAELKECIRKDLGNGYGLSDVARKFGVTTSTVNYHRDQIRKSDRLDAKIKRHEEIAKSKSETLDDLIEPEISTRETSCA